MTTEVVRPRKAQAPTGSGLRTSPAMVDRKIESNCHAWAVTSTGFGTKKRTMRPMEIESRKGIGFAPWRIVGRGSDLDGGDGDGGGDELAWIGKWGFEKGLKVEGLEGKEKDWEIDGIEREDGLHGREDWDLKMGCGRRWSKTVDEGVESEWSAKLSIGTTQNNNNGSNKQMSDEFVRFFFWGCYLSLTYVVFGVTNVFYLVLFIKGK